MPKGNGKLIPKVEVNLDISADQARDLLKSLQSRFEKNLPHWQAGMERHKDVNWANVQKKLEASPPKLASLNAMETTGGEPDVVILNTKSSEILFIDCSEQTPQRRSICYDRAGEELRHKKGLYPGGSAVELAAVMGIDLLTEDQYRQLQKLGEFDTKTSSWIKTPPDIRKLGGALFCDRRYDTVFTYHNGAESFYSGRGFRGCLKI